jgi:hypothetical protein
MKIGYVFASAALLAGLACTPAAAWDQDPFAQYLRRSDSITSSAGDAKSTNSVTHIIDPWPPYVGNRRIPGNGQRMSGAVERYRDVSKLPNAPKPIAPIFDTAGGGTGGQSQGQGQGQ